MIHFTTEALTVSCCYTIKFKPTVTTPRFNTNSIHPILDEGCLVDKSFPPIHSL